MSNCSSFFNGQGQRRGRYLGATCAVYIWQSWSQYIREHFHACIRALLACLEPIAVVADGCPGLSSKGNILKFNLKKCEVDKGHCRPA